MFSLNTKLPVGAVRWVLGLSAEAELSCASHLFCSDGKIQQKHSEYFLEVTLNFTCSMGTEVVQCLNTESTEMS